MPIGNNANLPTDFDDPIELDQVDGDAVSEDEQTQSEPLEAAKDDDGIPYCRQHHCRMKRTSGGKKSTATAYYKCPVPKCDCKAQIIKTRRESVVPNQPVCCPRCSTEKTPVICERSKLYSTGLSVVLQCPSCLWKSNALAVPSLAAQHFNARKPNRDSEPAGIGDR